MNRVMARASPAGMEDAGTLNRWRELFRGHDIFDVIDHAILVAAADSPQELRRRRDCIVERIFLHTAQANAAPGGAAAGDSHGGVRRVSDKAISKEASCSKNEGAEDQRLQLAAVGSDGPGCHGNAVGHGEMEVDCLYRLADEMDDDEHENKEVLRIKDILLNHQEQSAHILFDSLRRLELMQLTVEKVLDTDIERAVMALSKHKSHEIRELVRNLVKIQEKTTNFNSYSSTPCYRGWKTLAAEWIASTNIAMAGYANQSLDKSNPLPAAKDEEGLGIPPMEAGALFFASHATAIEHVSEYLGDTNDDPRIRQTQGTVATSANPSIAAMRERHSALVIKMGMPVQSSGEPKEGTGISKTDLTNIELASTKRKLHEAYKEAENAKKKRAIQVLELCDMPNFKRSCTTPLMKSRKPINRTSSTKLKCNIVRRLRNERCK
ncbi:hypothetical protein ACP70R_031455 [Stipagrostis hirtigluma subsp. patula]